ncbi:hypothetical protein SUGI_0236730 [Cryptomeria japonica]|nr:hypothetical protein SUGI_0236730 [Cryptomeria japonica]
MLWCNTVYAQLTPNFYNETCTQALPIVKSAIKQALDQEARIGLRWVCSPGRHPDFHRREKCWSQCQFAQGIRVATRDSVVQLGGPSWTGPFRALHLSSQHSKPKGLSAQDMVALSGDHTIGQASFQFFRSRIYNESNIDKEFAASLQENCPFNSRVGDNNLAPLDSSTANGFDNTYYQNLRSGKGLFHSDQELYNGGSADAQVTTYSTNQQAFFTGFAAAMVRMGNTKPLSGAQGEIRKNCRRIN